MSSPFERAPHRRYQHACAELVITHAPIDARTRSASVTNNLTDQPEIPYKKLEKLAARNFAQPVSKANQRNVEHP
jgi:hypothetical protein